MIAKIMDAFFRHKLLLLLPPLLIPLIVGPIALRWAPVYYETWTGIWVDRPAYLSVGDDMDRYTPPAQVQASRLNELFRTRSFMMDVARRTSLAPLIGTTEGEKKINEIVFKSFVVLPSTRSLLAIRVRSETPELSFALVSAIVEAFREREAQDRAEQASVALAFYETRVQDAEQRLAQSTNTIRRYVAANPRLTDPARSTTAAGLSAAVVDPQFTSLQHRVQQDQEDVNQIRRSLEEARLHAAAASEGQEIGFKVVDPPIMPREPSSERRRMLIYPVAGLLVGLGLSTALLVLMVASDRTGRTERDFADTGWVVGVVPLMPADRSSKKSGLDLARRAIGFSAGAALPAPRAAK